MLALTVHTLHTLHAEHNGGLTMSDDAKHTEKFTTTIKRKRQDRPDMEVTFEGVYRSEQPVEYIDKALLHLERAENALGGEGEQALQPPGERRDSLDKLRKTIKELREAW